MQWFNNWREKISISKKSWAKFMRKWQRRPQLSHKKSWTFKKRSHPPPQSTWTKDWTSSTLNFNLLSGKMKTLKDSSILGLRSWRISGKLKGKSSLINTRPRSENSKSSSDRTAWKEPPKSAITQSCQLLRETHLWALKAKKPERRLISTNEKQNSSKTETKT